jgi:hypothetical protein
MFGDLGNPMVRLIDDCDLRSLAEAPGPPRPLQEPSPTTAQSDDARGATQLAEPPLTIALTYA